MSKLSRIAFAALLAAMLCAAVPFSAFADEEPNPLEHAIAVDVEDGTYTIDVVKEGGTGKVDVVSPTTVFVTEGKALVYVEWTSTNFDYMIVAGEKYTPSNRTDDTTVFQVPLLALDEPMPVIADTTAMGTPHEIEYTLIFDSASLVAEDTESTSFGLVAGGVVVVVLIIAGIAIGAVRYRKRQI